MKRSKKLLFIIIPSLVVFFALSFLLTSTRQEELNTDIISTDTSISKSISDEMNKTLTDIRNSIDNKDSKGNRDEVVCGGVTITDTGIHEAIGSAWLHKCVAYTPWKCKGQLEGPYQSGCKEREEHVIQVWQQIGKHMNIFTYKYVCPAVNTQCATKIDYSDQELSFAYSCGICDAYDKKNNCIKSHVEIGRMPYCSTKKTYAPGGPICFHEDPTEGKITEALSKFPDLNLTAADVSYKECEPIVNSYDCEAVTSPCGDYKAGVEATSDKKSCCGNLCAGCTRECANHPPVVEPIDGETFTASSSKGSVPAYCINQHLLMPDNGKFMWDSSFNVTACKDSNSSKDCGYGYILLKSYALGYNYAVTNVALRLWAASDNHGAAAGYNDSPGVPVSEIRGFVEPHWNVYKQTAKEINIRRYIKYVNSKGTDFKNDVFKGSYKTVKKLSDLQGISCDRFNPIPNDSIAHSTGENMGILCTGVNEEYLKSIYLYILALQGNKRPIDEVYRKHLSNKCITD